MNKKIITPMCAVSALALVTLPCFTFMNNANASESTKGDLIATTNDFTLANTKLSSGKDETVYLLADADGLIKSTFIGSTLYSEGKALPFEVKVTYSLDGTEISASDLAHQSGHVKISYNYNATATYQGRKVPFVALTGLNLDATKFKNVQVNGGKILREGENYTVAGISVLGLNENLGTDFLPASFSIEADVSDFTLDTVYTLLLNDVIADLDTSELSNIDGLVSSMNQLSDGIDQIVLGSTTLSKGAGELSAGIKTLQASASTLSDGISSAAAGSVELSQGLETITANDESLQQGAKAIIASTLQSLNSNPTVMYILSQLKIKAITLENYDSVITKILEIKDDADLRQAKSLLDFATGVIGYTQGVEAAASGASELASGLGLINSKMPELISGVGTLASGADELYSGSIKLKDGIAAFKAEGIDQLVSFANRDLAGFTWNARQSVSAAKSYRNYANPSAESVKFIVKLPSIK